MSPSLFLHPHDPRRQRMPATLAVALAAALAAPLAPAQEADTRALLQDFARRLEALEQRRDG